MLHTFPVFRREAGKYGKLPYAKSWLKHRARPASKRGLPANVHELPKRAAEIQVRTLPDFVVAAAQEAASRTIEEADMVRLSAEGQLRIARAILKPAAPTPALRRAVQRRRALLRDA